MNQLETNIRRIMDLAMLKIIEAVQASPSAEIAGAFSNIQRAPVAAPARVAAAKSAPKRTRSAPINKDEVLRLVREAILTAPSPVSLGDVAAAVGQKPDLVAPFIKALRATGEVTKHGEKKQSRYTGTTNVPTVQAPPPPQAALFTPEAPKVEAAPPEALHVAPEVTASAKKGNRYAAKTASNAE